jgi:hypothetical protein
VATANRPTLIVQVAFDDGALVASPTWTTIAARSVSVTRGRSDETQRFGPGSATVIVPNKDRLYDPTYTAGTYYGKLLPMRQLRVRATWNAVTYDIFRGHVEGWPQKYNESNRDAYVELVANDAMTYLANVDLPSWQAYVAQVYRPTWWWPLDDDNNGEDFNVAREKMSGAHGVYQHDETDAFLDFSQDRVAPSGTSVNFDGGSARLGAKPAASTYAVGFAFRRAGRPTGNEVLFDAGYMSGGTTHLGLIITITSDGYLRTYFETLGSGAVVTGSTDLCDGNPHSVVALVGNGASFTTVYVDGVSIGTTTTSGTTFWVQPMVGDVTPGVRVVYPTYLPCTRTQIDEVMIWDDPTSFGTAAQKIGLALTSFYGQTPAARAGSLLDVASWPSALRDLDSDGPGLGSATFDTKLLSELQTVDASEHGRMFVTADGTFTLHSRWRDREASSATVSQATFADDGADHKYLARGFEYGYEVDRIVTSCTVTGPNVEYTATDATAVTAYGIRSKSIQTLLRTVNECRNLAEYIVLRYKDPVLRAKQFGVNAERTPSTMWPAVLGLELGDRITLQRTPQNVGTQISTALLVERIQHDIDQNRWETRLLGSPVDANTESAATYWVLGTSAFDDETVLYF